MVRALLYLIQEYPRYLVSAGQRYLIQQTCFSSYICLFFSRLPARDKDHGLRLILFWQGEVEAGVESRIFLLDVARSYNFSDES